MVESYNFFMQTLVNISRLRRLCTLIIDGGSCSNLALEELVKKLNLKTEDYPNPYKIVWVNGTTILVNSCCLVTFNFSNNFELITWCDVLPMKVAHIMLGRPWLFGERVQYDRYENTYTLVCNGRKKILRPMKEIPPPKQPEEKLAPLKLEEPSNTPIKKQVKVTSKEKEIINNESRKQKEIINNESGKQKEIINNESRKQNIIMNGGKHEESTEISFEYREFKNLIPSQDNLQKECGEQLSTSLLMTYNYLKNYQLVLQHWEVFQSWVIVLNEIEQVQEILISCFTMVKA
ncbi:hypothetical protein PVL29_022876 [Vitis rotundifolia]|uniref:Uncharacterized protein n=1 Tax=Vitis rotundifolia TaxID=103349 RepID=A0AA39DC39_VITRO|nr:hypothetical protein PVL29_022876 [Vitis rotundifolia]